jgi:pimeloyl-ACP methyl ester carboxylesterase
LHRFFISPHSLKGGNIHGRADVLIPASEGVALYEGSAAPEDKKRLVIIPGAGHNNLLAVGVYFEAIHDFVLG